MKSWGRYHIFLLIKQVSISIFLHQRVILTNLIYAYLCYIAGTLTRNEMDFRKCSIYGISYGQGITEIGRANYKLMNRQIPMEVLEGEAHAQANAVPHVSFYCPKFDEHYNMLYSNTQQSSSVSRQQVEQAVRQREFFRVLSICHDIIPEVVIVNKEVTVPAEGGECND
jgi:magnesium-transporting ATPase (P-type)